MMTRPSGSLVPALQDLEDPQSFNIVNAPYDLVSAAGGPADFRGRHSWPEEVLD